MGGKLGTIFARAGHDVVFSYARSERKLKSSLARQGQRASGTPPRPRATRRRVAGDALVASRRRVEAGGGPIGQGHRDLLSAHERRRHRPRHRPHLIGRRGAGQERFRKAHVVVGVRHGPERSAVRVCSKPTAQSGPARAWSYCGDATPGAKDGAATLIRDAGFEPVDAGPLRIARYLEPFALLIGQLAYETEGGPELAVPFQRLREIALRFPAVSPTTDSRSSARQAGND